MNPRRFLNLLKSPSGALALFLLGLVVVLFVVNSRRNRDGEGATGSPVATPAPKLGKGQVAQSVTNDIAPFPSVPPAPAPKPTPRGKAVTQVASAPSLPPLSLVAETPQPPAKETKTFSANFAPFGRLIPCELVITVDSSSISTPIVGLVTEDVFHHGQLIVPAGTEVHGSATVDRSRERIASDGRWTLVWQNGEELSVTGLALDHERDATADTWAITDGSAGLRGRLIKSDNLAEVKLYAAALLSGAADVFTDKSTSAFGSFALPSLQNAPLKGAQSVLDRYAQQIHTAIERDGFYVRVPAGKQFYLYITQTLDQDDATVGGTLAAKARARAEAIPARIAPTRSPAPSLRSPAPELRPQTAMPQSRR